MMIKIYSEKEKVYVYALYGIWEDFINEIGHTLSKDLLRTSTGEKIFIDWITKKWKVEFQYNEVGTIIEAYVDEKDYLLMILKYSEIK